MAAEQPGGGTNAARTTSAARRWLSSACARFSLAGVALALAIVLAASALVRWASIGPELSTFAVASVVLVALGLRLGRNVDSLERAALEDPMTRIGNRRHFDASLAVEIGRAVRSRMPLSVLVLDVDNLKTLNDAYGHGCGDRALALVAHVLRETCRSRDVAARFGGDEFAIVLPRTRGSEAKVVADRIRTELARRWAELGSSPDALVTVSMGIADLDSVAEPLPRLLFESADRALYLAKSAGRDRVEVQESPCCSGVIRLDRHRATRNGSASA